MQGYKVWLLPALQLMELKMKKKKTQQNVCSHVCFVVVAYLLDPDVIFGVYVGFSSGIGLSECYDTGYILKIIVVVYLDLLLAIDL